MTTHTHTHSNTPASQTLIQPARMSRCDKETYERVDKMCGKFASKKLSGNIEIGPCETWKIINKFYHHHFIIKSTCERHRRFFPLIFRRCWSWSCWLVSLFGDDVVVVVVWILSISFFISFVFFCPVSNLTSIECSHWMCPFSLSISLTYAYRYVNVNMPWPNEPYHFYPLRFVWVDRLRKQHACFDHCVCAFDYLYTMHCALYIYSYIQAHDVLT